MIGVMLKSYFTSAGGGPTWVLVTSEVTRHLNDDSGNSGIPVTFWAFQETFRPGPGPMGPTVPAWDFIGPYRAVYRALYGALFRTLFGCPILHCGLPYSALWVQCPQGCLVGPCRTYPPLQNFTHPFRIYPPPS